MTTTGRLRNRRRQDLTDAVIAALPRRSATYLHPDPGSVGLGIRVRPRSSTASNSFVVVVRDTYGRQKWVTIGKTDVMTIEQARVKARDVIARVKKGEQPFEPPPVKPDTVADVTANWLKRHVEKEGLRTADEIRRLLDVYVLPHWRDCIFVEIKRSDITKLLDAIEDDHGAFAADAVLTVLRSIANWFAKRDDDYRTPFVRGMQRTSKKDRTRKRILSDDELRAVWVAAGKAGVFGGLVKVLMLTAQRLTVTASMRWSDISDGVWSIPQEERAKGNAVALRLPQPALDIINAQPKFVGVPYVFAGKQSGRPMTALSLAKARLDAASGVEGWVLHDLRRTARSLMSRAGVSSEHAERTLGHAIPGIEGIYDRHRYDQEKAAALTALAALIDRITNPPADNVFAFPPAAVS
jgi:integrase